MNTLNTTQLIPLLTGAAGRVEEMNALDPTQIIPLLTGSVGCVAALYLWNRSLINRLDSLERERRDDKEATLRLQADVIKCIAEIQKSLDTKAGCRYHAPIE